MQLCCSNSEKKYPIDDQPRSLSLPIEKKAVIYDARKISNVNILII